MKKIINAVMFIIVIIVSFACENEFDPYSSLKEGYMLFCILDNRFDEQIAVTQKIHFPGNDKTMPKGTKLFLSENNGRNYFFRDTVINGDENYSYYYLPNFKPAPDVVYRLSAVSDSMELQYGQITYCKSTSMNINFSNYPEGFLQSRIFFSNQVCQYYTFNMYVEYEINKNGSVKSGVEKVPYYLSDYSCPDSVLRLATKQTAAYIDSVWKKEASKFTISYPGIYQFPQSSEDPFSYSRYSIFYALWNILTTESNPQNVTIKKIALVTTALYDPLFSERQTINSYVNYSLRLGEAINLTNIISENGDGHGYMGAIIADTSSIEYSSEIIKYFGYKDGRY